MNQDLRHRVRGFTLIELMIVLAIAAVTIVYAAQKARAEFEEKLAAAAADNIFKVGEALNAYMANNVTALSASGTPTTITVANLQAATSCGTRSCLSTSTVATTPWNSSYTMAVRRVGSGAPYQLEGLACSTTAWTINGATRYDLLGASVLNVGGSGGMTYDATSGAVGNKATWTATNANFPAIANVAGKLCYFVSSALDNVYLRTDGTNQMNATLQMGGNAIAGATNVTASGTVAGATMTASGAITAAGTVTGGNLSTAGAVTATGNITSSALVQGANVTATSTVTAATVNSSGNITAANNVIASNDVQITTLTSRASPPNTTSVKSLLPSLVEVDSIELYQDGQAIPVHTCPPGGSPRIFAIPQLARGPVSSGNWGSDIHVTGAAGGPWTFYARNSAGTSLATTTAANPIALGRLFCAF